ncbi:hypothetical protein ALC62_09138 [Cyphomyrmex costatus]|uniref:Uncharacterized protein n=1 Tax=Cyphomyrmex costatus TaxID=456900 RepID=A0A195CH63_9HYME|nr:hypothetical protein ALC62_09138 [Cyphomyrmex costatus]
MSYRNQLMNPGQEMLDDNIEYTTERRFPVAYEIRPRPVETSFSISVALQANHDGLCQQLVQRYHGIMEHEDKGTREGERGSMGMEKPCTVLSIPSKITLSKTACRCEKKRSSTKDDDRITLPSTLQRAIEATKYSELPQILETKTLERDVATAIPMGGRLEIRKNIPRKLTRIRKPARRRVNQSGKLTRARNSSARTINRNNFCVNHSNS